MKITATMKREIPVILQAKVKASQVFIVRHEKTEKVIVVKGLVPISPFDPHLSAYSLTRGAENIAENFLLSLLDVKITHPSPKGFWSFEILYSLPTTPEE